LKASARGVVRPARARTLRIINHLRMGSSFLLIVSPGQTRARGGTPGSGPRPCQVFPFPCRFGSSHACGGSSFSERSRVPPFHDAKDAEYDRAAVVSQKPY